MHVAKMLACSPIHESSRNTVSGLLETVQMMTGVDAVGTYPLHRRVVKELLQMPAMYRNLGPFVTRQKPAFLAPDQLASFGEIRQMIGSQANRLELAQQAELVEFANGVRKQVDTDAERLHLIDGLKNADRKPSLMETERSRQSSNTSASNNDVVHACVP